MSALSPPGSESAPASEPRPPRPAPTSVDPSGALGQPWWQRRAVLIAGLAAGVLGVVGVVAGAVTLGMASSTRSDAQAVTTEVDRLNTEIEAVEADKNATEAEIDPIETAIGDLEAERDAVQRDMDALIAATSDVADATDALNVAIVDAVGTYVEHSEVMDEVTDLYNQGATLASRDLLNTRGTETLAAFQASVEAEAEALSQFQQAVNALREEVVDGD